MGKKFTFTGKPGSPPGSTPGSAPGSSSTSGSDPGQPGQGSQAGPRKFQPGSGSTGGAPPSKFGSNPGGPSPGSFMDDIAAPVFRDPLALPDVEAITANEEQLSHIVNQRLGSLQESAARFSKTEAHMHNVVLKDNFLQSLADESHLRMVELAKFPKPGPELLRLLTPEQAKRLNAIPVCALDDGTIMIAIGDPSNTTLSDTLHAICSDHQIEIVVAAGKDIKDRIEGSYGLGTASLEELVEMDDGKGIEEAPMETDGALDLSDRGAIYGALPVVQLVNVLLIKAIKDRASDIHIEPFATFIRVRYRVDGVLREIPSPPFDMLTGLVTRIKVMATMNISESRLPQDGRIKLRLEGREVDLRVSSMPTAHGEAIVMRVLDRNMMMIGISQIGMTEDMLNRFMKHIKKPNGIILVTGPTGCGKTTTLYAAIGEVKDPGEKLITVEDPVEYEVPGIVQVNINEHVGLTFAKCIRAILRQDPDTVLVGEIRDSETAQIAIQASLTGHLVFSTLHTNSAAATVTRLIDMGIEPFLMTSSVEAVIGQRLIRTVCPTCKKPHRPSPEELGEFNKTMEDARDIVFYKGEGCRECGFTGYRGRMGLFELFEMNDDIREMILTGADTDQINEGAKRCGMKTMREDGWLKITLGLTTLEEVARETPKDIVTDAYQVPASAEPAPAAAPAGGGDGTSEAAARVKPGSGETAARPGGH